MGVNKVYGGSILRPRILKPRIDPLIALHTVMNNATRFRSYLAVMLDFVC